MGSPEPETLRVLGVITPRTKKDWNPVDHLDAEQIRLEMIQIRGHLQHDGSDLVYEANRLTDWKAYVRAYPLASAVAATAAGFFIVPRRRSHPVSGNSTTGVADDVRLAAQTRARAPGLLRSMTTLAGSALLRAGLAFAGQYVGKMWEQQHAAAAMREGAATP